MRIQKSAQLASQSHHPPKKRPRWLSIIIIIACILTLLSFIGAAIIWIGLVHDKLSDTLGAIFTVLGTIFGFIALILAIPPFFQYLRERRSVPSPISAIEPEIEPTPGARTTNDHQTYFINNPKSTGLSGTFHGPVKIGGNDQIAFNQHGWIVHGNVVQSQGDITVADRDVNRGSAFIKQVFADLEERIKLLPPDDKDRVQLIASQAKLQAEKLQHGDTNYETQISLEKQLKSLYTINPSIGNRVNAELANSSAGVSSVIQRIAKRVQMEVSDERK